MRYTNNTLFASDNVWTSELVIQGKQTINVGLWIGSLISYASVVLSTASAIITLQRHMSGDPDDMWRDVEAWSVQLTDKQAGNSEDISDKLEPETCTYRFGIKKDDYQSGTMYGRLGTS